MSLERCLGVQIKGGGDMSKAEIEKIVKAFYKARWSNDLEKVGDYLLLDSRFIINAARARTESLRKAGD